MPGEKMGFTDIHEDDHEIEGGMVEVIEGGMVEVIEGGIVEAEFVGEKTEHGNWECALSEAAESRSLAELANFAKENDPSLADPELDAAIEKALAHALQAVNAGNDAIQNWNSQSHDAAAGAAAEAAAESRGQLRDTLVATGADLAQAERAMDSAHQAEAQRQYMAELNRT